MLFHYNIQTDPMLGIGYVAVRWIPCSCYVCLKKLVSPWNRRQDSYSQDRHKGKNQQCVYWPIWQVPNFGGQFCPIFGQEKDEFLATTVITFSVKRFRISFTYVYEFQYSISCFVCCLQYYEIIYLSTPFKKTCTLTYMHTKLPMMDVKNSQTDDCGRSK